MYSTHLNLCNSKCNVMLEFMIWDLGLICLLCSFEQQKSGYIYKTFWISVLSHVTSNTEF